MVASEAVPFAKTGGLADVASALPEALGRLGHRVAIVLPLYRGVTAGQLADRRSLVLGGRRFDVGYVEHTISEHVRAIFVDVPELFDRPGIYGEGNVDYPDNALRYGVLARAALEAAAAATPEWQPQVIHAHDWQAGLVPVYLRTHYASHATLGSVSTIFTIHNLAFQGLFPPETLPRLDLAWDLFTPGGLEFWGKVSFLKGGIMFADRLTTVSPRYAREILTPELGFGFDGILRSRKSVLTGILNGIDPGVWSPETDKYLPAPFSRADLSGKREAKQHLLDLFGLPSDQAALDRPLIGMVSRMTDQKGFDLLGDSIKGLLSFDASYALVGTGEPAYEAQWSRLAAEEPGRVGAWIGFDERRAHLAVGGADLFLMPSRFEPCGLNQMYSLRYGTVPVVRATGGLADTVANFSQKTGKGTGFTFRDYSPAALQGAVKRALSTYKRKGDWRAIQLAGMECDYSWDVSAREYVKVYRSAVLKRRRRSGA
jgi:starch synthase